MYNTVPAGKRIVSENSDGIIKIWDSISGEPLGIIDPK
jgi:hypothetical protein